MSDQVEIRLPKTRVTERSAFTATAVFRTRASKAATSPGSARYRIDDLGSQTEVRAWTSLTPAASIDISITAGDNAVKTGSAASETKQITVQAEHGTDSQVTQTAIWKVTNIYGIT